MIPAGDLGVVCPICHRGLHAEADRLRCADCARDYPVVAGIPDLRIEPDPWIGLEEDRAKALLVLERSRGRRFEDTVRTYWDLTPTTPTEVADGFVAHVLRAEARTRAWLERDPPPTSEGEVWIDLGCGTADLAAAAPRSVRVVGIDVALRWLVIARKRLEEAGLPSRLICANAEALPLPPARADRVYSLGLLEHCPDPGPVLREASRMLVPGGVFRARTVNRYTVLPEPHVGVWGVGFVPRGLADRYVRWRSGLGYEHHRPSSAWELGRGMRRSGFRAVKVEAAPTLEPELAAGGRLFEVAAPVYDALRRIPVARAAVRAVAPLLELRGQVA